MINEDAADSNKREINQTYFEALNGPSNIHAVSLKKANFSVQVRTQGIVEEGYFTL